MFNKSALSKSFISLAFAFATMPLAHAEEPAFMQIERSDVPDLATSMEYSMRVDGKTQTFSTSKSAEEKADILKLLEKDAVAAKMVEVINDQRDKFANDIKYQLVNVQKMYGTEKLTARLVIKYDRNNPFESGVFLRLEGNDRDQKLPEFLLGSYNAESGWINVKGLNGTHPKFERMRKLDQKIMTGYLSPPTKESYILFSIAANVKEIEKQLKPKAPQPIQTLPTEERKVDIQKLNKGLSDLELKATNHYSGDRDTELDKILGSVGVAYDSKGRKDFSAGDASL